LLSRELFSSSGKSDKRISVSHPIQKIVTCSRSSAADPYPGSEFFFPSRIPDTGSKRFPDPGSGSALKNLSILTQKIVSKHQYCGSGMFIPDPDFYPSRTPDPKTATEERSEKKICCHTFLCSHKFDIIENYFCFAEENFFQRIIELFNQKIVTKLSKIWV
jgi:hypothetical protein